MVLDLTVPTAGQMQHSAMKCQSRSALQIQGLGTVALGSSEDRLCTYVDE